MTTMWGVKDQANNSPIWAPARVKKKISRANANTLYGNTTANAYNRGTQSGNAGVSLAYPATGVFAVADAQLTRGGIGSITIDVPGSGALTVPILAITGGDGSNTVTATTTAQAVGATVNAAGTGYAPLDQIHVTGGTGANATANVVTTKIVTIAPTAGHIGTGFANGDVIVLTSGVGTNATANVVTGAANTSVASLTITTAGVYTTNPTLANSATANVTGSGSGLQVAVTMGLNTVLITNGGAYSVLPTINAAPTSNVGGVGLGGTTGTLALSFGAGPSATITANGSGYKDVPAVTVSATGLTGAKAHANLAIFGMQEGVAHTGWILRSVGTGGRAGRVQTEVLVAGGITGSANTVNEAEFPE